jgi:hypothetical protein
MALSMTQPTGSYDPGYTKGTWNSGTYQFTLFKIEAGIAFNKFNEEWSPSLRFIFVDAEGDAVESNTIRMPKGLQYNDKANLWNYVGALYGQPLTEADQVDFVIPGVETYEQLFEMPKFFTAGDKVLEVESIKVNGQELIGSDRQVNLTLSKEISAKGNEYNTISTIAPVGGGGKVKREKPAGAPS